MICQTKSPFERSTLLPTPDWLSSSTPLTLKISQLISIACGNRNLMPLQFSKQDKQTSKIALALRGKERRFMRSYGDM